LGTPDEDNWPNFNLLSGAKHVRYKKKQSVLREKIPLYSYTGDPTLSDRGYELLKVKCVTVCCSVLQCVAVCDRGHIHELSAFCVYTYVYVCGCGCRCRCRCWCWLRYGCGCVIVDVSVCATVCLCVCASVFVFVSSLRMCLCVCLCTTSYILICILCVCVCERESVCVVSGWLAGWLAGCDCVCVREIVSV